MMSNAYTEALEWVNKRAKKKKKLVKRKAPERGYAHWHGETMERLSNGEPEVLTSSFAVSHAMMLNVLDRQGDGCMAMKRLLVDNHETRKEQRRHIRRAVSVFRSLIDADIVELLSKPDELGRPVRVNLDLQDDFRLNQPLSLFVVEAIEALDPDAPDFHLQVLSLVESVIDDPMVILFAQLDKAKDELISRLKSEGVEYDQRMAELDEVTWPRPEAEFIEPAFDVFARHHPWVERDHPRPKAIAREMLEYAETFNQYVARYGLKRSEGLLLRYLTDCYKTLVQTVPTDAVNEDLGDVTEWLGAMVRRVDSSLLDEWERLRRPDQVAEDQIAPPDGGDLTSNWRAFSVLVRNEVFRWVQLLANRRYSQLIASLPDPGDWTSEVLAEEMATYWDEHDSIGIDGDARAGSSFDVERETGRVRQTLHDPAHYHEWMIEAEVDLERSRELERAVIRPIGVRRL